MFEPDLHLFHLGQGLFGEEDGNPLKMVGQHLDRLHAFFLVFATFEKGGIDMDGPTFDVFQHGFDPADFLRWGLVLLIA